MTGAGETLALLQAWMGQGFLVFLRIGPVMALLPAFSEQAVPMRVKLVLTVAFTMIVLPAVPLAQTENAWNFATTMRFAATETVSGLTIGIGIRLFILALQTAGSIAAQSTSLSQILGNAGAEPMPAIGQILVISALALAMITGLHIKIAQLLVLSYDFFPPGQFLNGQGLAEWGTAQIARAFSLAFTLAAPFVIISVLYNLTLGVINRAMPQLMVAFVGAPVITAGGLMLLLLMSPLMLSVWIAALDGFLVNPFGGNP